MAATGNDYAVCAICFLDLIEPRQLPCGHVFCTSCLQDEIDHCIKAESSSGFPCPSCSAVVKQTEIHINQSGWAKMFPPMNKTPHPSTENRSVGSSSDELPICSVHLNLIKNIFCKDCFRIICEKCATAEHLSCSKVFSLQNAVSAVDENLHSYMEEIKVEEENLDMFFPEILPMLQRSTESIDTDVKVAREMIKKTSRELVETIKKQEAALLLELDRKHKVERSKLEQSLAVFNNFQAARTNISLLQKSKKDLRFIQQAEMLAQELLKTKMYLSKFQGILKPEVKFIPDEHSLLTFKLGSLEITLSD